MCMRIGSARRLAPWAALGALLVVAAAAPARAHDYTASWADGCCHQPMTECNARPGHPDAHCRHGHTPGGDLDHSLDPSCWLTGCIGNSGCKPWIETGSVPEVDNDVDDDCDGYVDDEQCDGDDNDGDGAIDEDLGSCMMRLVFVPACFDGTQAEFEAAVQGQIDFFLSRNGVEACADNFRFEIIDKADLNLDCTGFDTHAACDSGPDRPLARWRMAAASTSVFDLNQFDILVMATNRNICGTIAGQSNTRDALWTELGNGIEVLAHEIGHVQGLGDEYCSQAAGSTDTRCNTGSPPAPPPVNWLGSDLGCDPAVGSCCDACTGINVCCEGNANPHGGRCVMSYVDAPGPRYFCERCEAQIFAPVGARSTGNPTGQVPMDCSFAHLGNTSILNAAYRMDPAGNIDVEYFSIGNGRLGVGGEGSSGGYGIEVRDSSNNLLYHSEFDASFRYHGPVRDGVDYGDVSYDTLDLAVRAPLPPGATASDPFKLIGLKDGNPVTRTTLNGSAPTAHAGTDQILQCTQPNAAQAVLNGLGSSDPDGDTLRYTWFGFSADDASSATPTVTVPIGPPTTGSLVVYDGMSASAPDWVTLAVVDTVDPVITAPGPVTLQCNVDSYAEPGATAADVCDPTLSVNVGGDTVDPDTVGVYTVEYSTVDDSGNDATATRVVTVADSLPPSVSAPNMTIARCLPAAAQELLNVSVSDQCTTDPNAIVLTGRLVSVNGTPLASPVVIAGSDRRVVLPIGTSVVEWVARDLAGNNSAPVAQSVTVVETDTPAACCTGISTPPIQGNAFPNTFIQLLNQRYCVFGYGSVDTIVTGLGADFMSGGSSLDFLTSGSSGTVMVGRDGADVITLPISGGVVYGGSGDDVIEESFGGVIYGNAGDDSIVGVFGVHEIHPGPGRDFVQAGPGDDTVVIFDECELEPFEVLDGSFGTDTLVTPLPVAELVARGVVVLGFNNVVIDTSKRHLAECF